MRRALLVLLYTLACAGAQEPNEPNSKAARVEGFAFLREEAFSCGGQARTVAIYRHERTGLEFVLVPGGEFMMGSPEEEAGRLPFEGPRRRVAVAPFLLCRTEVPGEVFKQLRPGHQSGKEDGLDLDGGRQPAVRVSWDDAGRWCLEAGLRLPSEAEWEYACRAGTETVRFWGDGEADGGRHANAADRSAKAKKPEWMVLETDDGRLESAPVGSYQPNAFGLHDMLGNVWEWCADAFVPGYSGAALDARPRLREAAGRVARGGSWKSGPRICRCAYRGCLGPESLVCDVGFRPACSVPPDPAGPLAWNPILHSVPGFELLREEPLPGSGSVRVYRHERTRLEFVLVPGGRFEIGGGSARPVAMRPFLICTTEATQKAWARMLKSFPSRWKGAQLPVEQVSWDEAQEWCRKAGLRLPTEAEWEYACRAGSPIPGGLAEEHRALAEEAWFFGNSGRRTAETGRKKPNRLGLFDMRGNVWEWVEDAWNESHAGAPVDGRARGGEAALKVIRGGGWVNEAPECRSTSRRGLDPGSRSSHVGFRPACSVLE